jgi:hypothetical protein
MKRYALVLTTLATLFVTGITLHAAGWFGGANTRQAAVKAENSTSSIPAYYRQAGPRHWRDCMGQN